MDTKFHFSIIGTPQLTDILDAEDDIIKRINDETKTFYYGFSAESYLTSMLQREQWDVIRSNTDYGIDLIAVDRNDVIRKAEYHPLYFQVKSARIQLISDNKEYDDCISFIRISSSTLSIMNQLHPQFGLFLFLYMKDAPKRYLPQTYIEYDYTPFMYCWFTIDDFKAMDRICAIDQSSIVSGNYYGYYVKTVFPLDDTPPYVLLSYTKESFDDSASNILNEDGTRNRYSLKGFLRYNGIY